MAKNPLLHARTMHIEAKCHLIRDYMKKERIQVEFVRSSDQAVHGLKNPSSKTRFVEIRNMLKMMDTKEKQ